MSANEELIRRVEKVLDEDIRPALEEHLGGVRLKEIEGDVLKVELIGACATCPSAYITREQLIEETIVEKIDEINKVVLIQDVGDDLIKQAKELLKPRENA